MNRLISFLYVLISLTSFSQGFEGLISYKITHTSLDSTINEIATMPTKLDFYISGELARIDQSTKIGTQTTIIDTLLKRNILLINLMDKKFGIILDGNDTSDVENIIYSEESEDFLGIECKKAIINSINKKTKKSTTSTIYYTNKIDNSYNINFKKLKGFPIYYEIISNNIISTYLAVEMTKKNIDPKIFEIDNKTSIYKMEDFRALMTQ
ncbi:MAG: hypothetical protein ISQ99_01100 [Flavobacteriales bacterium]|nr:hypothetical protein [Flavobacteriales bacterium]MBL6868633.1 hypothetical protein [Flavobacteriales bacterium]CAI8161096.1 MAG: Uncharacterised protein [Crocinitomicaceae bacterium]|tara:strand:- start:4813 stop:5442 length:630 start_codon:yes stop_codon:yes gene_type:complete